MRDRETIDSELRRLAVSRRSMREQGSRLSSQEVDDLLDERLGHRSYSPKPPAVDPAPGRGAKLGVRQRVLRRIGLLAVVPLALLAVGAAFIATFGGPRNEAATPTEVAAPPSISQGVSPAPPVPPAPQPQPNLADQVFVDVLKQEGVPVPSQEYATTQAHAVCGFLARQPDLAEAVHFVQQSTVWDADQSSHFAAGAVVSYCPEYERVNVGSAQQPYQSALTDLQAIERRMRGIEGDLAGIRDGLQPITGP